MFKKGRLRVNTQSVHLETKCQSGCSETLGVAVGGRSVGAKMSLGRYVGGFFVKALVCTMDI
jgi:hypothetical protein